MKKKSQLYSQVFIYILTLVLIAFILIYGYNAIQNFRIRAKQVECLRFKNDLVNSIDLVSNEFGSVKRKDMEICGNYRTVCFAETYENPSIPNGVDPIIRDSMISNAGKNVFLIENIAKESFYAGKISVEPDVLCVNTVNSRISLRLEGKGNHVLLSEWG